MTVLWIAILVVGAAGAWRAWLALRASVAAIPPECAACRYPIKGLEAPTCPECGADLSTPGAIARTRGKRRGDLYRGVNLVAGCGLAAMAISMGLYAIFGARVTAACSLTVNLDQGAKGWLWVEWAVNDPFGTPSIAGTRMRFEPEGAGNERRRVSGGDTEESLRRGMKALGLAEAGPRADEVAACIVTAQNLSLAANLNAQSIGGGAAGVKVIGVSQTVTREARLWIPFAGLAVLLAGVSLGGWRLAGLSAHEASLMRGDRLWTPDTPAPPPPPPPQPAPESA